MENYCGTYMLNGMCLINPGILDSTVGTSLVEVIDICSNSKIIEPSNKF